MPIEPLHLTGRFTSAIDYARHLHIERRKGTDIPYMAHLLGVASLVMGEAGQVGFAVTEDMVIAALLHDAAKDHGGITRLEDIEYNFGTGVARIVGGLTDSFAEDSYAKELWLEREHADFNRLRMEAPDVRLISAADALHNARAILEDYRMIGPQSLDRFRCGHEDPLSYFTQLLEIFDSTERNQIVDELYRVVAELKRISENGIGTNLQGDHPEPDIRQTILEVGAEGGSLAVFRERNAQGMWEYRSQRDETTMSDVLPDEKFDKGDLFERSGPTNTFEDALSQLDRYPWFRLFPLEVHPDFTESILREVEKRGGKEAAEDWLRILPRRPRF